MATNPILMELANLSPGAQAALKGAAGALAPPAAATTPAAPAGPPMTAPQPAQPSLTGAVHQQQAIQAEPAPAMMPQAMKPMSSPGPSLPMPAAPNVIAPRGTLEGDTNERSRLLSTGSGISQIAGKVEGAMPNHPLLGKLLGGAAQGVATLGDALLAPAIPAVLNKLPGTDEHHNVLVKNANNEVAQDEANAEKQAQTANLGATTAHTAEETAEMPQELADKQALIEPTVEHIQAETGSLLNPQAKSAFEAWQKQNPGAPVSQWLKEQEDAKPKPKQTPQEQTYDALLASGMTPMQAYEKIRERIPGTGNVGTWAIDEDKDGNPVMFNSKTGQTEAAPPGIAKAGTHAKAEAALAPTRDAIAFANEYASGLKPTGPLDEALMEKYFEVAKPSTGFRMSQPQIDMLKNAQSMMGSLEAHIRHAAVGTWFSDAQRKQIIDAMNDLAKAKGLDVSGAAAGAAPGGKADYVYVPGKGLVKQ